MKYDFLKHLNKSELTELESIILGKSDNQELLTIINTLTQNNITLIGDFASSFIPNYDSKLEDKCNELLKTLSLNDLFFFATTFSEKGNTKKEGKDFNIFPEELLIKMSDYEINGQLLRKKVEYPWAWFSPFNECDGGSITFDKIDNMFKDNIFSEKYEGTYNMLNYIKNYVYYLLKQNPNITREDIFSDFIEKKYLVHIQLKDISSYLCEIRDNKGLRLCISNLALSRNAVKTTFNITPQQETFIECLAFGNTLEKIKNRDYEDYKKLLYLPR